MGKRWINKVLGVTKAKRAVAKATGVPTTRGGRRAKFGCSVLWVALTLGGLLALVLTFA